LSKYFHVLTIGLIQSCTVCYISDEFRIRSFRNRNIITSFPAVSKQFFFCGDWFSAFLQYTHATVRRRSFWNGESTKSKLFFVINTWLLLVCDPSFEILTTVCEVRLQRNYFVVVLQLTFSSLIFSLSQLLSTFVYTPDRHLIRETSRKILVHIKIQSKVYLWNINISLQLGRRLFPLKFKTLYNNYCQRFSWAQRGRQKYCTTPQTPLLCVMTFYF
jgi:hypothetical protein